MNSIATPLLLILIVSLVKESKSYGLLMEPPARNSMWRLGYRNPVDLADAQLRCGGSQMYLRNGGKCGVCGDNWADDTPRSHEAGGKFGNGIIVRRYFSGQDIDTEVLLSSNSKGGSFRFNICPVKDSNIEVTQECLNRNPVAVLKNDGSLTYEFPVKDDGRRGIFYIKLRLPRFFTCTHCVLQWTYITKNSYGVCPNGISAAGCGPPEKFVNCADISINTNTGSFGPPLRFSASKDKENEEDNIIIMSV